MLLVVDNVELIDFLFYNPVIYKETNHFRKNSTSFKYILPNKQHFKR